MNKRKKVDGVKAPSLYLDSGYLNFDTIIDYRFPFTVIVGGRAIGKTFGILDFCIKNKKQFIYMRRSQSMVEQLSTDALNPIKSITDFQGKACSVKKQGKYISRLLVNDNDAGIMVALSTFANLRGFDASDYEVLIFDEFIPQENEKKMKGEGIAFLNAIETISRNRELQGRKSILSFLLTNSNTLNSEILLSLNLFDEVLSMQAKNKEVIENASRGLRVIRPISRISEMKKETTLYKFAGEGDFSEMSLSNKFEMPDVIIKSYDLKGWKPKAFLSDLQITIYKKGNRYYCSNHLSGVPKEYYHFDKKGLLRFNREQSDFIRAIQESRTAFQNVKLFYELTNYLALV